MVFNPWIQLNHEYWLCCKLLGRENSLRYCKHQSTLWEWLFTQTSLLGSAHSTIGPWQNSLYFLLPGFWKAPLNAWTVTEFKVCIFFHNGKFNMWTSHTRQIVLSMLHMWSKIESDHGWEDWSLEELWKPNEDKSTITLHGPRLLLQGNLAKGSVLVFCSCVCNWMHTHTHLQTHTHTSEGPFILRM